MAPKEKQKIEIEKSHRNPLLSFNQAVTLDCSDFLGTALMQTLKVTRVPGSEDLWSPRWSPDGRYLVGESLDSRTLMLFDFESKKWMLLRKLRGSLVGYTSWSRDSKWVYFNSIFDKDCAIIRVSVPEGRAERFLDLSAIRQPETLGQWFTLAPDGAPLVLRNTILQEIYSMTLHLR
jgi:Tol biopolymer transport system component